MTESSHLLDIGPGKPAGSSEFRLLKDVAAKFLRSPSPLFAFPLSKTGSLVAQGIESIPGFLSLLPRRISDTAKCLLYFRRFTPDRLPIRPIKAKTCAASPHQRFKFCNKTVKPLPAHWIQRTSVPYPRTTPTRHSARVSSSRLAIFALVPGYNWVTRSLITRKQRLPVTCPRPQDGQGIVRASVLEYDPRLAVTKAQRIALVQQGASFTGDVYCGVSLFRVREHGRAIPEASRRLVEWVAQMNLHGEPKLAGARARPAESGPLSFPILSPTDNITDIPGVIRFTPGPVLRRGRIAEVWLIVPAQRRQRLF